MRDRLSRLLDRMEPTHRPIRNPLEFCVCVVLAITVFPVAIGVRPVPNSLKDSLPDYGGQASAAVLVIGCLVVAAGIIWLDRDMGIIIQQAGMWLVGSSLFMYGLALGVANGWNSQGAIAGGVCFGLALGFLARIAQFQLWVRRRKRLAVHL